MAEPLNPHSNQHKQSSFPQNDIGSREDAETYSPTSITPVESLTDTSFSDELQTRSDEETGDGSGSPGDTRSLQTLRDGPYSLLPRVRARASRIPAPLNFSKHATRRSSQHDSTTSGSPKPVSVTEPQTLKGPVTREKSLASSSTSVPRTKVVVEPQNRSTPNYMRPLERRHPMPSPPQGRRPMSARSDSLRKSPKPASLPLRSSQSDSARERTTRRKPLPVFPSSSMASEIDSWRKDWRTRVERRSIIHDPNEQLPADTSLSLVDNGNAEPSLVSAQTTTPRAVSTSPKKPTTPDTSPTAKTQHEVKPNAATHAGSPPERDANQGSGKSKTEAATPPDLPPKPQTRAASAPAAVNPAPDHIHSPRPAPASAPSTTPQPQAKPDPDPKPPPPVGLGILNTPSDRPQASTSTTPPGFPPKPPRDSRPVVPPTSNAPPPLRPSAAQHQAISLTSTTLSSISSFSRTNLSPLLTLHPFQRRLWLSLEATLFQTSADKHLLISFILVIIFKVLHLFCKEMPGVWHHFCTWDVGDWGMCKTLFMWEWKGAEVLARRFGWDVWYV